MTSAPRFLLHDQFDCLQRPLADYILAVTPVDTLIAIACAELSGAVLAGLHGDVGRHNLHRSDS